MIGAPDPAHFFLRRKLAMINFLSENIGTIVVLLILVAIVAAIIYQMRKDKKSGKSTCGGNCSGCANSGACHSCQTKPKKK